MTDTQTDGQTPLDDIGRACIASRGKNEKKTNKITLLAVMGLLIPSVIGPIRATFVYKYIAELGQNKRNY